MGWSFSQIGWSITRRKRVESVSTQTRHSRPCRTSGQPMTSTFRFDEINYWSELKLDIVQQYGSAYTKAFVNQPGLKKFSRCLQRRRCSPIKANGKQDRG